MYVAMEKLDGSYHIDKLNMDGTGRIHLVEHSLVGPISLHYNQDVNRIFWADGKSKKIESVNVHGKK